MHVNLFDYAPRIGSGWRQVEVVTEGWKWVTIKYNPKVWKGTDVRAHPDDVYSDVEYIFGRPIKSKIRKSIWETLPKSETLLGVVQGRYAT
jgi:hypothetical protein|tara:strand:- start:197 stop:469 length:273 start_codon:yes stop_codon:yes gene_type:complete